MRNVLKKGKVLLFLIILAGIWIATENILQQPKSSDWNTKTLEKIKSTPNYYDVIVAGTSMAVTNISAEELYLEYGIASISIGKPQQTTFLSYYALEDALKYQNPKVVIFDVQSIFYPEETQKEWIRDNEEYIAHYTIDDITNVNTKYEAVKEIRTLSGTSTYWDYFSKMYHNHSNWENIGEENFKQQLGNDIILGSRSLVGCHENAQEQNYVDVAESSNQKVDIPELNKQYLQKISDLCKKNNTELLLVRSCGNQNWSWEQYNTTVEIADQLDAQYIDLTLCEREIGFDWHTDSYDGSHHNAIGTKKWTDYVGKYLTENYEFIDKRGLEEYQEYENVKEKYQDTLNLMETKIELVKATNFNQYLDTLLNMKKEDTTIFMSVYDDASSQFSDISKRYMAALGFNYDLQDKYRYSYYGILDNGKNIEEMCNEEGKIKTGILDTGVEFEISSGGALSDVGSSIKINGIEYGQNGRGINIVVYNKRMNEVMSSVYFDTCINSNPATTRIKENQKQVEVKVNMWENE